MTCPGPKLDVPFEVGDIASRVKSASPRAKCVFGPLPAVLSVRIASSVACSRVRPACTSIHFALFERST